MALIAQIPKEERPRERLLSRGSDALSLTELLAICLGSGYVGVSALSLAEILIAKFGTLAHLLDASVQALMEIKGIGPAKALQLKAIFALAKRSQQVTNRRKHPIQTPEDVYHYVAPELQNEKRELVYLMLRDVKGNIFHGEILGIGTLTEVVIHPRELFYLALHHRAFSVLIAHNHPSGDPSPSKADIELTRLLVSSGKLLGIPLDDHLIIGHGSFTSLWKLGHIKDSRYKH